jgi:TPR repeat protein
MLEEFYKNAMKSAKDNDPVALNEMGNERYREGDYDRAFEYLKKAADLGDLDAHFNLSCMYQQRLGDCVEKDLKKIIYHLEEAAIGGHPEARNNLGCYEEDSGRIDRAMKHFIIAAKLGYNDALDTVKQGFVDGLVSKEDFEAALRGHQTAVDATKSEQRDAACAFYKRWGLDLL